jgi:hypothetical protein
LFSGAGIQLGFLPIAQEIHRAFALVKTREASYLATCEVGAILSLFSGGPIGITPAMSARHSRVFTTPGPGNSISRCTRIRI